MYISIGKKLKLDATNDERVSRLVRDYSDLYNYIYNLYASDLTQPIKLDDLLTYTAETFEITYSNIPADCTFEWSVDGTPLGPSAELIGGTVVDYVLTYPDGSKCEDSFVVYGDVDLDLSTLEPNRFILTITANKTLEEVRVYHNYSSGSAYTVLPVSANNIYTIECSKNENVRITSRTLGFTEVDKIPDFMNIENVHHDYTNITSNISDTFNYQYTGYISLNVYMKDSNGQYITMDSSYSNYITWTPDDASLFLNAHVDTTGNTCFNAWKSPTIGVNYAITFPQHSTINGGFGQQSSGTPSTVSQTHSLEVEYKVNIEDYEYTLVGKTVTLTKYIGVPADIDTPELEEV